MLVTTWLSNIAFHLRLIWLQTLVAIDSESRLTLFPSFCVPPSEVAVLFDLNLSRRPFLGPVVDLDLLRFTGFDSEHAVLFLWHICTQRQMAVPEGNWRFRGRNQQPSSWGSPPALLGQVGRATRKHKHRAFPSRRQSLRAATGSLEEKMLLMQQTLCQCIQDSDASFGISLVLTHLFFEIRGRTVHADHIFHFPQGGFRC